MKSSFQAVALAAVTAPMLLAAAPAGPDWKVLIQDAEKTMWVDAASIRKQGDKTLFTIKLKQASEDGYSISENQIDCATSAYKTQRLTIFDDGGKQLDSMTFGADEGSGTMSNTTILKAVCPGGGSAKIATPANPYANRSWTQVFDQGGNKMWVDSNSVVRNGAKRTYVTRMTMESQPQYTAYMTNDADCAALTSRTRHMDVEENGAIVNSSDEGGDTVKFALQPLIDIVCK